VNGNKNYLGVSSGVEPIFALFYTRRTLKSENGCDTCVNASCGYSKCDK